MKTFDFPGDNVMPVHIRFLGYILLVVALPAFIVNSIAGIVILILGVLLSFTSEGTEFDREKHQFREYNRVFFIKMGTWEHYQSFEKLFINPLKTSQFMYTRVNTGSTITDSTFMAYLKISDHDTIPLKKMKNKGKLHQKLMDLGNYLQIPVQDNTQR